MIYIQKEGIPSSVEQKIIEIKKSDNWKMIDPEDTNAIRNVFDDEFPKEEVKQTLVHEQHGLCAYCMKRIRADRHSRVEHLIPLSEDKENAINYDNLLGVCDGGESLAGQCNKVLCCDAHKKDDKISLSPLNKVQMDKIAYDKDGRIYTKPYDRDMEKDINDILGLNGVKKSDGSVRDTSTELLKGRKDAYERVDILFELLNKRGKFTSAYLARLICELETSEEQEEFVGVKLYRLKKKLQTMTRKTS